MNCNKSIERIIGSIRMIEKQIEFFENDKSLFWKKKNNDYIDRIEKLEAIREKLYKRLENILDNKK